MLVIFFDIDGVLNHYGGDNLDADCISRFNQLWSETNALFVMTSSWRVDFINSCKYIEDYGGVFPIIGATPNHLYDDTEPIKSRESEILHWIKDNVYDKNDFNFIIIDDVDFIDKHEELREHFVHTDFNVGFSERDLQNTLEIFGKFK